MSTTSPPLVSGPPYGYISNINIDYNNMNKHINNIQDMNSLYLNEINNILNNTIPNFANIIPNKPSVRPNAQSIGQNVPSVTPNKINHKYDFMKAVDKSSEYDDLNTLDISNEDTYNLIIQQNTMYILGSLACASLLIASIFIGRRT
jgi:hypothetical protein